MFEKFSGYSFSVWYHNGGLIQKYNSMAAKYWWGKYYNNDNISYYEMVL